MPPLRPLPPCHRHLTPLQRLQRTSLHRHLMHLYWHLPHFISPLTPSHRLLTFLRRHLTLLLTHKYKCFSPFNAPRLVR